MCFTERGSQPLLDGLMNRLNRANCKSTVTPSLSRLPHGPVAAPQPQN